MRIVPLKRLFSHEDLFHISTNPPKKMYSPLSIASMRTFLHKDLYLKRTISLSELLLLKDSYPEVASRDPLEKLAPNIWTISLPETLQADY